MTIMQWNTLVRTKTTTEATTFRTSKAFIGEWNCHSRTGGQGIIMIITIMDCFYIMMIAVIFGFIIHLEVQIRLQRVMMEEHTKVSTNENVMIKFKN